MDGEEGSGIRRSKRFAGGKVTGGLEVEYKTKSGTAWSHSFLNQKPWHPLSYPNQRRKWIAEQTHAQHDRRAEEVAREFAQEQEFFKQAASSRRKKERRVTLFTSALMLWIRVSVTDDYSSEFWKIEVMKAVSFMYVRPPSYDPESARAAEYADEKHEGQSSSAQDPMADDNVVLVLSIPVEAGSDHTGKERKKPRPKVVFENAPRHETGIAGRVKPFAVEDAVMPNEELRLKRDDPLTAIIAHTDPGEWELKQKPGLSPPRGGFDLDDPNLKISSTNMEGSLRAASQ
ncbi:unnamed protein product [Thlaspi arvense]|uniref:CBF1-interacting co-repressor CIR N-terminal domain-containing protein n=1 Tax=Thlaspi arvense TaxID=13288 RepID=A0AAU9T419_THLAR|nr:unnamed protein product [Thlaspi arvense]